MTIKNENIVTLHLTEEEYNALETVDNILKKISDNEADYIYLVSLETGECLLPDDVKIARGIVTGVRDHRCWSVNTL